MGETNISTRRKNSANTFQHLGLKNKTSFHSFAETPIKAAKRKINYHSIYIIQCTHYHSHTFFQILPGLESLVVEQQQSSSERSVRMLWFTVCGQDAHANTSGGGGGIQLLRPEPQHCVGRDARTRSTRLTRCQVKHG